MSPTPQQPARYFVECEETCPDCDGAGEVYDWRWSRFNEAMRAREQELAAEGAQPGGTRWNAEFNRLAAQHIGHNWRRVPEFLVCDTCHGRGVYRHRVPLLDALQALGLAVTQ